MLHRGVEHRSRGKAVTHEYSLQSVVGAHGDDVRQSRGGVKTPEIVYQPSDRAAGRIVR